ncbi:putative methionyl-tRNA synthetase [Hordeum vulgare]|nr:putative methionyl-tRNA synthetase [Hordeum vulgare]
MDEIITSDSVATASCPGFGVQDETMDTADDMDDELDDANEEEEEGEEEQVKVEPEPASKARKKKRASNASIDPIACANQNTDTYWGRIKTTFDERKLVDPDFANIHMDRGDKAMTNHRATIQTACNKWHEIVEEVTAGLESDANVEGQMVRMFGMYRQDNNDQEFKFLHAFSRIKSCEKWREVRLVLAKAKETYNPEAPATTATEGRPDGTKKARAARDAAQS